MNPLDLLLLICLILCFVAGWKMKAINLLGFFLAIFIGIWSANRLHHHFIELFRNMPDSARFTFAWIGVFLFFLIVVLLTFSLVAKTFEIAHLIWLDHLVGAIMASILMLTAAVFILFVVEHWSPQHSLPLIQQSRFAPELKRLGYPLVEKSLQKFPQFQKAIK